MTRTNANRELVVPARRAFMARYKLDYNSIALIHPTHSCNVETYKRSPGVVHRRVRTRTPRIAADFDRYLDGADGILTSDPGIPVGLVSGDCVPLVVWDTESSLHGIVHIGLLGALNRMTYTLDRSLADHCQDKSRLRFLFGPYIGPDDYNLATSGLWNAIVDQVAAAAPEVYDYTERRGDGLYVDLGRYVREQLETLGYSRSQIDDTAYNTGTSAGQYFSHHLNRANGPTPRFMSVIGYDVGTNGSAS